MASRVNKVWLFLAANIIVISIGLVLSITLGAKRIELDVVWNSLFHYQPQLDLQLVRDVRLPRALCALMAGGLLGITGAMMQGVTRNPVAEPSLMGISQGATLVVAIVYAKQAVVGVIGNLGASFLGALLSGLLVIAFTARKPSNASVGKILLAGTALSTFFLSLASVVALLSNQSQNLGFWLSGGFRTAGWVEAELLLVFSVLGLAAAIVLAPKINIVNLGDDVATGFGVNPFKVRIVTLLLVIPLCAASVAVGRNIGFVGLVIPQITARCVGQDYKRLIPCSFLLGGALLVFADVTARLVSMPYETPIGIFTALIGVPFFIFLVRKERG